MVPLWQPVSGGRARSHSQICGHLWAKPDPCCAHSETLGSRGRSNVLHCELGQHHPFCVCIFIRVHTGSLTDLARLAGQQAPGFPQSSCLCAGIDHVQHHVCLVNMGARDQTESHGHFADSESPRTSLVRLVCPHVIAITCKCDGGHGFCPPWDSFLSPLLLRLVLKPVVIHYPLLILHRGLSPGETLPLLDVMVLPLLDVMVRLLLAGFRRHTLGEVF